MISIDFIKFKFHFSSFMLKQYKEVIMKTYSMIPGGCGIIVESIIELTVYALDGLIYGLCASKYGFVCM